MLRAGALAQRAADAKGCVDMCDAVLHANRIYGTSGGAVAVAETAVSAGIGTAVDRRRSAAGVDADVNSFYGGCG